MTHFSVCMKNINKERFVEITLELIEKKHQSVESLILFIVKNEYEVSPLINKDEDRHSQLMRLYNNGLILINDIILQVYNIAQSM